MRCPGWFVIIVQSVILCYGGIFIDNIQKVFFRYIKYLELAIAGFLSCALIISCVLLAVEFFGKLGQNDSSAVFAELLGNIFTLIIGVEFIRMILKPTSSNVLEVILFTTARSLVLDHSSMTACLLGVLALGGLFAVKKYLFVEIMPKTKDKGETPPAMDMFTQAGRITEGTSKEEYSNEYTFEKM